MLLLPLLLIWTRSPMNFDGRWKTSLIGLATAIALIAPPTGTLSSSSSDRAAAQADDRFGNVASGFGAPPTRKPDTAAAASGKGGKRKESPPTLFREGTVIPATTGRFVVSGARWNFVPDPPPAPARSAEMSPMTPTTSLAADPSSEGSDAASGQIAAAHSDSEGSDDSPKYRPRRRMIVTENLMLQRVVESIRLDSDDNRWTVTGEVTEFFGENRLLLHTVQRASGG